MAASKPILGVLESGSEVRCLIEDTHGGLCCEPGEYDKVEKNIRWFIENAGNSELKSMGARGRENLEKNLTRKITIGENTCIGGNCKILDNDFHPIEAEARNKLLRDENGGDSDLVPSREIKIGKNCFIGCNSIILKGTVLGDGCVVGAGAVVAGKFEDNCVIAGNPARVREGNQSRVQQQRTGRWFPRNVL